MGAVCILIMAGLDKTSYQIINKLNAWGHFSEDREDLTLQSLNVSELNKECPAYERDIIYSLTWDKTPPFGVGIQS